MSTEWAGVLFVVSMIAALALAHRPVGDYIARSLTAPTHLRAERVVYRLMGVDPGADQRWPVYARSLLAGGMSVDV